MGALPAEVIHEYSRRNNFTNPKDVFKFLKESFKDVLQEMLEAETDVILGYSSDDAGKESTENSRNGYTPKTEKSELGPI
jgi:putative transposase